MSSHREHRRLCKQILGSGHWNVHRIMDVGYVWLRGQHRKVGHDWWVPLAIAFWSRDWRAGAASLIHLIQDES